MRHELRRAPDQALIALNGDGSRRKGSPNRLGSLFNNGTAGSTLGK